MRTHRPNLDARFTSDQVARAAGISYRQLDYWIRIGLVQPTRGAHGSGSQRRFSHRDVLLIAAVGELMRLGAGTDAAERLWLYLDVLPERAWPATVVITPTDVRAAEVGGSGWYLDLLSAVRATNTTLLGADLEKAG